jgi:hypothetical protein
MKVHPAGFIAVSLLVLLACTGCGSKHPGVITGMTSPCVGPAPAPGATPFDELSVTVEVVGPAQTVTSQTVKYPWRYSFTVAPGQYTVQSGSDTETVKVVSGATVQARVSGASCT